MAARLTYIAVVGPSDADPQVLALAEKAGALIAEAGAILVTGGLGGAMEAACRGAHRAGGTTVGILPGASRDEGNDFLDVAIPTAMGEMRNALVVRSADGVLAISGGFGTLSEIALALALGKPVMTVGSWELAIGGRPVNIPCAETVEEAVSGLLQTGGPGPRPS
jgi:uncharacterized protein (TIGR00725 family)